MADIYPKPEPSEESEPGRAREDEGTGFQPEFEPESEPQPGPERELPEPEGTAEEVPPPGFVESETAEERAAEAAAQEDEPTPQDIGPQPSPEPSPVPPPLPETEPGRGSKYRTQTIPPREEAGQGFTIPPSAPPEPLSPEDERLWAMLAHLSVLVNLVTGFLGPVVALLIYLIFKDRSKYVAFQSMQAFVFQMVWWIGGGILAAVTWTLGGLLVVILVGCLLFPLALLFTLMPLVALVYGVIGAVETNQGRDFRYWLIGDWVRDMLR